MSTPDDAGAQAREAGLAARKAMPRRQLAEWDPGRRSRPALDMLLSQHAVRAADLLPIRYGRMSASPWTYLRGAAAVMAEDLAAYPNSGLTVQLCGDAHVLNFGLWASPERNLVFDLRDFDETHPGPFEWDVKRLATSLVVCARENELPEDVADAAVQAALDGYVARMREYTAMSEMDIWYDRIDADAALTVLGKRDRQEVAASIAKQSERRTSIGAFRKLTEVRDGRRQITDDPPFRVRVGVQPGDPEMALVREIVDTYRVSVPTHLHRLLERFTFTDVARQIVGVGSVGMRVFLMLVEGRSGKAPMFFQIKQATASVYEPFTAPSALGNHGERVVVGQRLMQSATDQFAGWTRLGEFDFYVRQFRDMKIIPDSQRVAPMLVPFAAVCGQALAKAHARGGEPAAIAGYIGSGATFTAAIAEFARAYADQTSADHAELVAAVEAGSLPSAPGW